MLDHRLGDEHSIERISVDSWELAGKLGMVLVDPQEWQPRGGNGAEEVRPTALSC